MSKLTAEEAECLAFGHAGPLKLEGDYEYCVVGCKRCGRLLLRITDGKLVPAADTKVLVDKLYDVIRIYQRKHSYKVSYRYSFIYGEFIT